VRIGKQTYIPAFVAFLLGGAGVSGLQAQESNSPYSYLFKIRAGLTAGDMQKTHFDNKVMGFAAEVKREMPNIGGALSAEINWEYVPGRHHDVYPWDTNPMGLSPRYSFDNRKEYGAGLNLRFAYSAPMPQVFGSWANDNIAKDMDWFGGLSIDRFKVRSEVKYTLNFSTAPNPTNPDPGLYDGGAFVEEGASLVPGFFAGLRYRVTNEIGFELSVRNFGMWHLDYTPNTYKYNAVPPVDERGKGTSSTGTTRGWAIEFAITAKL